MDTTTQECKLCHVEGDCIEGLCSSCAEGDYFCKCNNPTDREQLERAGVCKDCM
jgi:hypothetical protein